MPSVLDLSPFAPEGEDLERIVRVTVTSCAYSCCARSWVREGYEQVYEGRILRLTDSAFTLGSPGLGTWTYMITANLADLLDVEPL